MEKINVESYVSECFVKCAHVILGSRIYTNSTTRTDKRARKWFLLEIDEVEAAVKDVEQWRKDLSHPMVIEVFMPSWAGQASRAARNAATSSSGELLLERWTLQYERHPQEGSSATSAMRSTNDEAAVYKRMILLVRSLYSYVRILPAYRMFRASKRHNRALYQVEFRILKVTPSPSTTPPHRHLEKFAFAPVDTAAGSFRLSVEYQPAATVHIVEQATSPSLTPRIIPDYVSSQEQDQPPAARLLRHAVSASVYDERMLPLPDPASSPPITTGAGILRNMRGGPAPVVRHSWSSKEIQAHIVGAARPPDQPMFPIVPSSLPEQPYFLQYHRPLQPPPRSASPPSSPTHSITQDILLCPSPGDPFSSSPSPGDPFSPSPTRSPQASHPPETKPSQPPRVASLAEGVAEVAQTIQNRPEKVAEVVRDRRVSGMEGVISPFISQQNTGSTLEAEGALAGAPRTPFDASGKPPNLGFQASAPVSIPGGGRHRARSVTDLLCLDDPSSDFAPQAVEPCPPSHPIAPKASTSAPPTALGNLSAALNAVSRSKLGPQVPRTYNPPHTLQVDEETLDIGSASARVSGPRTFQNTARFGCGTAPGSTTPYIATQSAGGTSRFDTTQPEGSSVPNSGINVQQGPMPSSAGAGHHALVTRTNSRRFHTPSPYPNPDASAPPNLVRASTSSETSSSASSAFPMSCSPQLPFAFTPSTHSLASFAEQHALFLTYQQQHGGGPSSRQPAPSPPNPNQISGRDISALATIRRPSWGSRSSSFDVGGGPAPQFSVSMSPLQDMLDSSIMSTSTPRRFFPYSPASSPALMPAPSGGSFSQQGKGVGPESEQHSLPAEESESDILPFALDENTPNTTDSSRLFLDVFPMMTGASTTSTAQERENSVTSFLRVMTEALDSAPIRRCRLPVTVGEALNQLQQLTGRIQAIVTYD